MRSPEYNSDSFIISCLTAYFVFILFSIQKKLGHVDIPSLAFSFGAYFIMLTYNWKVQLKHFNKVYFLSDNIEKPSNEQSFGGVNVEIASNEEKNRDVYLNKVVKDARLLRNILFKVSCIAGFYFIQKYILKITNPMVEYPALIVFMLLSSLKLWQGYLFSLFMGGFFFLFVFNLNTVTFNVLGLVFLNLFLINLKLLSDFYWFKITLQKYRLNTRMLRKVLIPQLFVVSVIYLVTTSVVAQKKSLSHYLWDKLMQNNKQEAQRQIRKQLAQNNIKEVEFDQNQLKLSEFEKDLLQSELDVESMQKMMDQVSKMDISTIERIRLSQVKFNQNAIKLKGLSSKEKITAKDKEEIQKLVEAQNLLLSKMQQETQNSQIPDVFFSSDEGRKMTEGYEKIDSKLKEYSKQQKDHGVINTKLNSIDKKISDLASGSNIETDQLVKDLNSLEDELQTMKLAGAGGEKIDSKIATVKKNREIIKESKQSKKSNRFEKIFLSVVLFILGLLFLRVISRVFGREKIVEPKVELAPEIITEILNNLARLPKKYKDVAEEIRVKYHFFHQTTEAMYYEAQNAPPPMILPEVFEEKSFYKSAEVLGIIFNNLEYAKRTKFSSKEMRAFRKAYDNFLKIVRYNIKDNAKVY